MTKVLLATHVLLWAMTGDSRLSPSARRILLSSRTPLFFSAASYWEISIKRTIGKIELRKDWPQLLDA
ncbi:MAG: hypothetical protein V1913_07380 [Fibrobacterota bacterium]